MHTRLMIRGVEILTMIEEVRRFPTEEGIKLIQKLVHIGEGIVKIRKSLKNMQVPAPFTASFLVTAVAPIKSDLDDADPIFEELLRAIRASEIPKANKITDGLILRICDSLGGKI